MNENEVKNEVKLIVKPKQNIGYYFIRNIWIFGLYVLIFFISIFVKIKMNIDYGKGIGLTNILDKVLLVTFIIIIITYVYRSIRTYIGTRTIKYVFYDNYVKYDDNFLDREQKQISYEHISEVTIKQPILDRILKTGTVFLNTPVEMNSGIFLQYVDNPDTVAQNIRDIIER